MKNSSIFILAASTVMFASFANAATSNSASSYNMNQAKVQVQHNQNQIKTNSKHLSEYSRDLKTVNWAHNYYKTKNDARLDADETKISNNYDSIQAIKKTHQGVEGKIQANQTHIASTQRRLVNDEQQIETNNTQIHSASQSLQSDATQIQSNSLEIKSLKADFERMAENIDGAYANAAALNALTEPHNVGNVMLSFGVGHHGSADALAMGASERFSDQLTAKFGAAYNSVNSSMTTFVGIGYEF